MLTDILSQVEPQEKKKTPKGRAKKRITYTRRFVNVTLTGGKRKVSIQITIFVPIAFSDAFIQMNPNPTS
jgi:small subunit ribosomal protein S30e